MLSNTRMKIIYQVCDNKTQLGCFETKEEAVRFVNTNKGTINIVTVSERTYNFIFGK